MKNLILKSASASIALVLSISANAALVGRLAATPGGTDYQAYYDTVLDISWLADANTPYTSGYDSNGRMSYLATKYWIETLNDNNHLDHSGWRLPQIIDIGNDGCNFAYSGTDCGYNVDTSTGEMASLFYDTLTGNMPSYDPSEIFNPAWAEVDAGPFANIWTHASYWGGPNELWTSTEGWKAWSFGFGTGMQKLEIVGAENFATAVLPGDIGAVPVPAAVWLFGSGLIGLIGVARRKKAAPAHPCACGIRSS